MPRAGGFFYQVSVADGFADDCDELMLRCSKKEPLTFHAFCKIWKEMRFSTLYRGRTLSAEIAELSEELLHIAKRYLMMDTSNFEESVAGLFLVYALYNQQPHAGLASLRLTPADMPALSWVQAVARRERRFDVLYILGAVLVKASQYHVDSRERGMDVALRKYLDGCTGMDRNGVRPKGVLLRQNEEMDILREVTALTAKYTEAKTKVAECQGLDASYNCMNYSDRDLSSDLSASLKKLINGILEDGDQAESAAPASTSPPALAEPSPQEIKRRAMKSAIASVRHLTSINERKAQEKSPSKCEIKLQAGRVRRAHLTKPVTSLSSKKPVREASPQPSTSRESPSSSLRSPVEDSSFSFSMESPLKSPSGSSKFKFYGGKGRGKASAKGSLFSDSSVNSDLEIEFNTRTVDDKLLKNTGTDTNIVPKTSNEKEESQNKVFSNVNQSPRSKFQTNRSPKGRSRVKTTSKCLNASQLLDTSNILLLDDTTSRNLSPVRNGSCAESSRLTQSSKNVSSPSLPILGLGYLIDPLTDDAKEKNRPNKVLTIDNDKNKVNKESPRQMMSPKSSPGGIRTSKVSPKKKSPLVAQDIKSPRRYKRRRKISSSESSDSSDESVCLDGDSDLDVSDDKLTDDEEDTIEQVISSKKGDKKTVDNKNKNAKEGDRLGEVLLDDMNVNPEHVLDIEINSLPIFIKSDKDGSLIEIKLPNEDKPEQVEQRTDIRVLRSRLRNSTEVSLSKISDSPKKFFKEDSSEKYHTMAKISKITKASQPKEKTKVRSRKTVQKEKNIRKAAQNYKNIGEVAHNNSFIRRSTRCASNITKSSQIECIISKSPKTNRRNSKSAQIDSNIDNSPKSNEGKATATQSESTIGKSPKTNRRNSKSAQIDSNIDNSPKSNNCKAKATQSESTFGKSPKSNRRNSKAVQSESYKSPKSNSSFEKVVQSDSNIEKSPKSCRSNAKAFQSAGNIDTSPKNSKSNAKAAQSESYMSSKSNNSIEKVVQSVSNIEKSPESCRSNGKAFQSAENIDTSPKSNKSNAKAAQSDSNISLKSNSSIEKVVQSDNNIDKSPKSISSIEKVTQSDSNIGKSPKSISSIEKVAQSDIISENTVQSDTNIGNSSLTDSNAGNLPEDDININKSAKIKRPDKREQKKTLLKSKFSRMGILPIANFKDNVEDKEL